MDIGRATGEACTSKGSSSATSIGRRGMSVTLSSIISPAWIADGRKGAHAAQLRRERPGAAWLGRDHRHRRSLPLVHPSALRRHGRPVPPHAPAVALWPACRRAAAVGLPHLRHGAFDLDTAAFRASAADALERFVPADRMEKGALKSFVERLDYVAVDASQPADFAKLGEALCGRCRRRALDLPVHRALAVRADGGGVALGGADGGRRAPRAGKAARAPISPPAARSTTPSAPPFPSSASSASTIISARRRCRTCWRCASATSCSSRCGTPTASSMSRSPCPRRWGWKAARASTTPSGALRDMVQNHMLQLLALVAMEPPSASTGLRDPRREGEGAALAAPDRRRSRRASESVIGQYAAGAVAGQAGARLCRRAGRPLRHRDLRRAEGARRQLALARRALLPAHRQAPAQSASRRSSIQFRPRAAFDLRRARRASPCQHSW